MHKTLLSLVLMVPLVACWSGDGNPGPPQPTSKSPSAPPVQTAAPAATAGSTPCEIAYEQTKAMIAHDPQAIQNPAVKAAGFPKIELAPRDVFLKDCGKLPGEVQKCLVYKYAYDHNESCRRARAEYDGSYEVR